MPLLRPDVVRGDIVRGGDFVRQDYIMGHARKYDTDGNETISEMFADEKHA